MFKVIRFTVIGFKSDIILDLGCFRPRSMFVSAIMSFRARNMNAVKFPDKVLVDTSS